MNQRTQNELGQYLLELSAIIEKVAAKAIRGGPIPNELSIQLSVYLCNSLTGLAVYDALCILSEESK